VTESLEMYLETISVLHERSHIARVTDIANELGVTKPSVHMALHELEKRGFIEHENYGEVFLTAEGKVVSSAIRNRHEILTAFLRDVLKVNPETAEKDACRMEHIISEETLLKIAGFCQAQGVDVLAEPALIKVQAARPQNREDAKH